METEKIIEIAPDQKKKMKRRRRWLIAGIVIVALASVFFILLLTGQKDKQLNVTGDPAKDSKIVTELVSSDPAKVKEYLGFVVTEYAEPAKMDQFKTALESAVSSMVLKVSGDPQKDALVFTNVAFLEVNNQDVCINKAMEFLANAMSDPIYQNDAVKMAEFRAQLDLVLNNEGMSLSDLGF